MIFPDRFPFDVLDPDPAHCLNCSCALADGEVLPDCRNVVCDCHTEWLAQTPENELRALWGDK